MKRFLVLGVLASLLIAVVSAPANAGDGDKIIRRGSAGGSASHRIAYQSAKGRQALAAAEAAGASVQSISGGGAALQADFDNDGRLDLAIGVHDEDYGATNDGAVHVIYGTANGLAFAGNQIFGESDFTVAFSEEEFGAALAAGDFDGDGFDDLAVGIPEWNGNATDSGAVLIIYGSAAGLNIADRQFITQDVTNVEDADELGDTFGASLAAGNFGNGAADDLAVGVPSEDLGGTNEGAVQVFHGGVAGLDLAGDSLFTQDSSLVEDVAETGDNFGSSLAAANFGQSSHADLAIGVPLEDVGVAEDAGAVNVLFGSAGGLTNFNDQLWHQDRDGIKDVAEEADSFGISLAAGNFGRSSHADLAVGVYFEGLTGQAELAGAVNVLYGGTAGLASAGNQFWSQNSPGIADTAEIVDFFGWSLAAANFGKTSHADLAIGAPIETLGAFGATGVVHVLYGTANGLTSTGSQFWHQDRPGILGSNAASDTFGWALMGANFGKTAQADLAVGVPGEDIGLVSAGAVNVLYGTATGLSQAGDQRWHQDAGTVLDTAEAGDGFGDALG